jgi:hypothetical protein
VNGDRTETVNANFEGTTQNIVGKIKIGWMQEYTQNYYIKEGGMSHSCG